jgi:hypothetical protein
MPEFFINIFGDHVLGSWWLLIVLSFDYIYYYLLGRLLESVHGGNYRRHEGITPLDQQAQLFTKAIDFPVKETQAWTEKVLFLV